MIDFEYESDLNVVAFFKDELNRLAQGQKLDRSTLRTLKSKGLVTQNRPFNQWKSSYKLTDLCQKLLEEIKP